MNTGMAAGTERVCGESSGGVAAHQSHPVGRTSFETVMTTVPLSHWSQHARDVKCTAVCTRPPLGVVRAQAIAGRPASGTVDGDFSPDGKSHVDQQSTT